MPHTLHFQLLQTLNIGKKQSKAKISRINRQYCRRRHTDELGEALAYTKSKSISASMSWPVTEAELAHYEEVMEILKSRWSGIPAEAKVKMATVNDDSVQREESMNEFKATWTRHANSDGTLTREEFCVFNHKHLSNIKARLGWAPDLTKVDSEHIWEAIHALNPDINGISLADYSRYHAVMKNYIH